MHMTPNCMSLFRPKSPEDLQYATERIQNCIIDIKAWMTTNFLKLNNDKTEIIVSK